MDAHREVELKYDVDLGVPVPDLLVLPKVAEVDGPIEFELEAVYFDTADHALLGQGITLRRRTGGDDEGWHLKLPQGPGDREELRAPLSRGVTAMRVPRVLRPLVQAHARGRSLEPVATLTTHRVLRRLVAADGTQLAEHCDDHVTATATKPDGSVTASAWREWEVELLEGKPKLLRAADELAHEAGAATAGFGTKLARALGTSYVGDPGPVEPAPSTGGPARLVVRAHLAEQVATLKAYDPWVRLDRPDSVHKMRVATRRLRSALATWRPLLDPEQGKGLRGELAWLAAVLGDARDAEVMSMRLTTLLAEDDVGSSDPGALTGELEERCRSTRLQAVSALDSTRYFRLLDALDALVDSPPWTDGADSRARKVLPGLVRHEWRRVAKRVSLARQAAPGEEADSAFHEVRKAAKRLRYACEALAPVFGRPASDLASAAERIQEVLGEHQDSVVSQALLRRLVRDDALTGDLALALGRLHLLEQEHAERSIAQFESVWDAASDKHLRRWLRS